MSVASSDRIEHARTSGLNSSASHRPRVSTSSIPLSFAYGAPALPSNSSSNQRPAAQSSRSSSVASHSQDDRQSQGSRSRHQPGEEEGDPHSEASTIRPAPTITAEDRYSKYRPQVNGGSSSQSLPYNAANHSHTSVNIATAFLNAQRSLAAQQQQNQEASREVEAEQEEEDQVDDSEPGDGDFDNVSLNQEASGADPLDYDDSLEVNLPSSLRSSKPDQQQRPGQKRKARRSGSASSSSSGSDNGGSSSRKQSKKRRAADETVELDGPDDNRDSFRKPGTPARATARRKSIKDPSYRPAQDLDVESDDLSEETEQARRSGKPKHNKQARVSMMTDVGRTPRFVGSYPTPGVMLGRQQHQNMSPGDDAADSSTNEVTFRLNPPTSQDNFDDSSSTNYDAEAEHVRRREEAAANAAGVASAVLQDPRPYQQSSAAAASSMHRPLPKPRREYSAQPPQSMPVPASQRATRNRNLGFEPPATDADGFGPEGGAGYDDDVQSNHSAMQAGKWARDALLRPLQLLASLAKAFVDRLRAMQWSSIIQGAALVAFLSILIGTCLPFALAVYIAHAWVGWTGSMIEDSSWLPRIYSSSSRQSSSGYTFKAPDSLPDSFEQLAERLAAVEKATSDLSFHQGDQFSSVFAEAKNMDARFGQMSTLVAQISDETLRLAKSTSDLSTSQQEGQKQASTTLSTVRNQIDAVTSRLDSLGKTQRSDAFALASLSQQVDSLVASTQSQDQRLQQLAKNLDNAVKTERLLALATEAIEQVLPQKLAVRVDDKSGKVHIDPAFWRYLQSAFDGKSSGSGASSDKGAAAPGSWPAFLAANEHNLRSLVESEIQDHVSSGAVLNKQAFMDLLKREVKQLKAGFEQTANENVEQIGQEMLLKVDRQLQQHAAAMNANAQRTGSVTTVETADGTNVTDLVKSLIDIALLQFSKDTLGKPDYALFTGGARVVPAITSPPLEIKPPSLFKRSLNLMTGGSGTIRGRPAVTALHPDLTVGSCWAFSGPTAQLGVRLSRRVIVSDVTIEHAAKEVAYDVSTAPSDFEVWGVVESDEDAQKLARARSAGSDQEGQLSSIPPSKHHMLLATGTYNPDAPHHIQTFPVFGPAASLDIPVSMVMLRVLGTQGGGSGCLYRFRVGGVAVE